eukprot:988544-Rhodomonas_salina.2
MESKEKHRAIEVPLLSDTRCPLLAYFRLLRGVRYWRVDMLLRDVRYWHTVSCYALAMRCPVLTECMAPPGFREEVRKQVVVPPLSSYQHPCPVLCTFVVVRPTPYAMSGTDITCTACRTTHPLCNVRYEDSTCRCLCYGLAMRSPVLR